MINKFPELIAAVNTIKHRVHKLETALRVAKIRKDYKAVDKNELTLKIQHQRIKLLIATFEKKMRESHLLTKLWESNLNQLKASVMQQPSFENSNTESIVTIHNNELIKTFFK